MCLCFSVSANRSHREIDTKKRNYNRTLKQSKPFSACKKTFPGSPKPLNGPASPPKWIRGRFTCTHSHLKCAGKWRAGFQTRYSVINSAGRSPPFHSVHTLDTHPYLILPLVGNNFYVNAAPAVFSASFRRRRRRGGPINTGKKLGRQNGGHTWDETSLISKTRNWCCVSCIIQSPVAGVCCEVIVSKGSRIGIRKGELCLRRTLPNKKISYDSKQFRYTLPLNT